MRKALFIVFLLTASSALQQCGRAPAPSQSAAAAPRAALWLQGADTLEARLATAEAYARADVADTLFQQSFRDARAAFKRWEFAWEYAYPEAARQLNGPDGEGFLPLEEQMFPEVSGGHDEMAGRFESMRFVVQRAKASPWNPSDSALLDAAKLQLFRIYALGITGFDSPLAKHSLPETRAALDGLADVFTHAFADTGAAGVAAALRKAARAVQGDFNSFDRLAFLQDALHPAYAALADFQSSRDIPVTREPRAFDPAARDLFSASAWNPGFFRPAFVGLTPASAPGDAAAEAAQSALGRRLFSDPVLSGDGSRSCATCHRPGLAFTDGLRSSPAVKGHSAVARNTPSLIHAAFQHGAFWDLRAGSLEEQAGQVIHNPSEMGGSLVEAAQRLSRVPDYAAAFRTAFASLPVADGKGPATPLRIRQSLTAYIRSLAPFASPWDRSLRGGIGGSAALDADAKHGFNVFMGKAGCATCHFPPLFNGTVPPLFAASEVEILGITAEAPREGVKPRLDPDSGRMAVDGDPELLRAFKTPTVRNAALTAPYMHNGAFATLEEVIEFYDVGGGRGLGLDVPHQTLPADSLKLSEADRRGLLAFLRALTDTAGTTAAAAPAARYTTAPEP